MSKSYKKYIEVSCAKCQCKWQKRADAIKEWNGHCRKCSYVLRSDNPEWRKNVVKNLPPRLFGADHPNWVEPKLCIDCYNPLPKKSKKSIRCKKCFDVYHKGGNHWNWQDGKSEKNHTIRGSKEYKFWATEVKKRDNYTCQICAKRGGELHSDHIKPFSLFSELRFDLTNGRTLCKKCHDEHGWSLFKKDNPRHKRKYKKHSLTTREKQRIGNLGQKRSEQTKTNLSNYRKEYCRKNKNILGEHIVCLNNGKLYFSHQQASDKLGIGRNGITRQVNGVLKQTHGYQFQKLTEEHLIF